MNRKISKESVKVDTGIEKLLQVYKAQNKKLEGVIKQVTQAIEIYKADDIKIKTEGKQESDNFHVIYVSNSVLDLFILE